MKIIKASDQKANIEADMITVNNCFGHLVKELE